MLYLVYKVDKELTFVLIVQWIVHESSKPVMRVRLPLGTFKSKVIQERGNSRLNGNKEKSIVNTEGQKIKKHNKPCQYVMVIVKKINK